MPKFNVDNDDFDFEKFLSECDESHTVVSETVEDPDMPSRQAIHTGESDYCVLDGMLNIFKSYQRVDMWSCERL